MKKRKTKSFPKSGQGASNLGRAFAGSYAQSLDSVADGYVLVVIREFQDDKGTAVLADTIGKCRYFVANELFLDGHLCRCSSTGRPFSHGQADH